MSKIGEKEIQVVQDVQASIAGDRISVKGKEGEIHFDIPRELEVVVNSGVIKVSRKSEAKKVKALHGLYRTLIANATSGVAKPWEKKLEIVGTGYTVKLQGEDLALKLGYSHQIVFKKVEGIKFQVQGNNNITVVGADKQLVGQVAHQIKMVRKPDPYKGKGIKYAGEKLRIKPGKKAKAVGAA